MYAVIDNQGKQYKVQAGDEVLLDLMDAAAGELVELGCVLAVGGDGEFRVGRPHLPGARVLAEVLGHEKGPKLRMMRHQPTKGRQAKVGHRQKHTRVVVREIHAD